MGVSNNSPTFSYVHFSGVSVRYNGELYMVQDYATNKKYIYYNIDLPYQLNSSNVMPDRSLKQFLVAVNDNGMATLVPSSYDNFSISFDGDSTQAIKDRIFGLYEKNQEFGEKFVAIEQDIDGIRQIVGSGGTGGSGGSGDYNDSEIWEKISQIEQTVDNIDLSVKETVKTFNDDKEVSKLREDLNSSIIKLNSSLGTFKSEITGYFKDNEISNEEKISVQTHLQAIENEKLSVDTYVDKVILIAQNNNQTQDVVALNSAKSALQIAHDNLKNNITNAIIDNIITPTEHTIIIDAFAKYTIRINEIKNTCDDIILLGLGGTIVEELGKISVKSDEIRLSISKVESSFTSDLSLQKIELQGQISDISSNLEGFKNTVETSFRDGIVDEAEKTSIKQHLYTLYKEKQDIEKQFSSLYASPFLVDTDKIKAKSELKEAYDNFTDMYEVLVLTIDEILRKTTIVDSDDRRKLEEDLVNYRNASAEYTTKAMNAIDCIAGQKAESESEKVNQKYADILLSEDGIINRVGNVEKNIVTNTESIATSKEQIAELQLTTESISQRVSNTETTSVSLQDQINAQATQITTTNSKVSTIEANLSNITQRVSHTEEVNTNLQSNVNTLNTRVEEAESKITKESITNTVKESFYTKDDIDGKGFTTQSQVQQTVNSLEIKFTESGGYNLIYNGDFKNGLESWSSDTPDEDVWGITDGLSCINGRGVFCRGELNKTRAIRQWGLELESNIEAFTLSYYIHTSSDGKDGTTNPYRSIEISVDYKDGGDRTYHSAGQQTIFGRWEKHVVTIEKPAGRSFDSFNIGLWVRDTTRKIYFSQVMVEVGSTATRYTQNPNEVYGGLTTITKDGIKVSMEDGEGEQGYTLLSHDGISVYDEKQNRKAWFGQDDTSHIDKLYANDIVCDRVVKEGINRPAIFYVSANPPSGSDMSGTSSANACNSINQLLNNIKERYGKYSDRKNIQIEVASGTYYENVTIMGWIGCGQIIVNLNAGVIWYGTWRIYDNTMMTLIKGNRTDNDTNDGARLLLNSEEFGYLFYIRNCHCSIQDLRSRNNCRPNSAGEKYGCAFVQAESANVAIYQCDISRYTYGLRLDKTCIGNITYSRGFVTSACVARYGSQGGVYICPSEVGTTWSDTGSHIVSDSATGYKSLYDPNYESTTTTVTPPTTTPTVFKQSFTVTGLKTVPEGSGSGTSGRSGQIGQGKWGSYKPHRGWGTIPSSLKEFCSGATNISMTLTMTRVNTSHGYAGAVPSPKIVHNSGTWSSGVAFARGNTKTITLPSTIVSQLSAGSLSNLQLWAGTSTNDYSFYNNVIINVTCTKNV